MWFCYLSGRRTVVIHRADVADDPTNCPRPINVLQKHCSDELMRQSHGFE